MIKVRERLPEVYYNESRDFQLLGRIFESIFNYDKTNTDCMENLYDSEWVDDKLVSLLAKTVGFESKHEYDIHNLKIICGCFNDILKYKGTRLSIDKAVSALLNAQGLDKEPEIEINPDEKQQFTIFIPSETTDVILLKDLFDYILPIGWDYSIINGIGGDKTKYKARVVVSNEMEKSDKETWELDRIAKLNDGESGDDYRPVSFGVISNSNPPEESGD